MSNVLKLKRSSLFFKFILWSYKSRHIFAKRYTFSNPLYINNLCTLVQRFFIAIILLVIDIIIPSFLIYSVLFFLLNNWVPGFTLTLISWPAIFSFFTGAFICFSICLLTFSLLLGLLASAFMDLIAFLFLKIESKFKTRKDKQIEVIEKSKQANLILQYIKDKHNKVCRYVEIED